MKLLIIADPARYQGGSTDVPETIVRGASVFDQYLGTPADVVAHAGSSSIPARRLPLGLDDARFFSAESDATENLPWSSFDVVFDRTLKPFPAGFLEALSQAAQYVSFVNEPTGIRKQHDSARYLLERAGPYLPDARIVSGPDGLASFLDEHQVAVLKRGNSTGGRGVFRVERAGSGFLLDGLGLVKERHDRLETVFARAAGSQNSLLIMRFLPRVLEGDKRVVVVGGCIYGAYLRRTPTSWLQNVSAGARAIPAEVGPAERDAVLATAPAYAKDGLRTLGYDFLTDNDGQPRISEINAGNIGGIARLERLGHPGALARFFEWLGAASAAHESVWAPKL